jgi:hypothetical protein
MFICSSTRISTSIKVFFCSIYLPFPCTGADKQGEQFIKMTCSKLFAPVRTRTRADKRPFAPRSVPRPTGFLIAPAGFLHKGRQQIYSAWPVSAKNSLPLPN